MVSIEGGLLIFWDNATTDGSRESLLALHVHSRNTYALHLLANGFCKLSAASLVQFIAETAPIATSEVSVVEINNKYPRTNGRF